MTTFFYDILHEYFKQYPQKTLAEIKNNLRRLVPQNECHVPENNFAEDLWTTKFILWNNIIVTVHELAMWKISD